MSSPALPNEPWEAVEVGDDLGSLDYVMTAEMIADYRRVVDNPHAAYPTVAARHPANLFYRKYASAAARPEHGTRLRSTSTRRSPGKRINVTARIADKYIRREKPYLVIEATATDEDGRLIEISRLVGLARPIGAAGACGGGTQMGQVGELKLKELHVGDRLQTFHQAGHAWIR